MDNCRLNETPHRASATDSDCSPRRDCEAEIANARRVVKEFKPKRVPEDESKSYQCPVEDCGESFYGVMRACVMNAER